MALINCPECSSEVSESALKCPKCGVQLRKLKRSFIGKLFKFVFIAFNVLMVFWIFGGLGDASDSMEAMSEAEKAGFALGAGVGAVFLVGLWVCGDLILGLLVFFTRPKE